TPSAAHQRASPANGDGFRRATATCAGSSLSARTTNPKRPPARGWRALPQGKKQAMRIRRVGVTLLALSLATAAHPYPQRANAALPGHVAERVCARAGHLW